MTTKPTLHQQIASYVQEVSSQIGKTMENDLLRLINQQGYEKEKLELCFYRHEPLRYSIRHEEKIIVDRWLVINFKCDEQMRK